MINKSFDFQKLNTFTFLENYDIKQDTDSPISTFFTKYCSLTIKDYIFHKEAELIENNLKTTIFIFILRDKMMITTTFDQVKVLLANPIIYNINYQSIYDCKIETNEKLKSLEVLKFDENFLKFKKMQFLFNSVKDLMLIHHFIEKYKILNWQIIFETSLPIINPFFYQAHFIVNKINNRGTEQQRIIILSNKFMYNTIGEFKDRDIIISKAIWVNSIEAFSKLAVPKKKDNLVLKIYCDKKNDKKILEVHKYEVNVKEIREFKFFSQNEMNLFIFHVRRIYFSIKKSFIKVIEY